MYLVNLRHGSKCNQLLGTTSHERRLWVLCGRLMVANRKERDLQFEFVKEKNRVVKVLVQENGEVVEEAKRVGDP